MSVEYPGFVPEVVMNSQEPEMFGVTPGGIEDLPEQLTDTMVNATRRNRRRLDFMKATPLTE